MSKSFVYAVKACDSDDDGCLASSGHPIRDILAPTLVGLILEVTGPKPAHGEEKLPTSDNLPLRGVSADPRRSRTSATTTNKCTDTRIESACVSHQCTLCRVRSVSMSKGQRQSLGLSRCASSSLPPKYLFSVNSNTRFSEELEHPKLQRLAT